MIRLSLNIIVCQQSFFSLNNLESKESMFTNSLDALEPGIHLGEIQEMFSVLASLASRCDDLQRRQKEIPSLSLTNQRRVNVVAGRIASLKIVLERRAAVTPSRSVTRHPSEAFLSEVLPPGWERSFTEDDIPYYVNHSKEVRILKCIMLP